MREHNYRTEIPLVIAEHIDTTPEGRLYSYHELHGYNESGLEIIAQMVEIVRDEQNRLEPEKNHPLSKVAPEALRRLVRGQSPVRIQPDLISALRMDLIDRSTQS